MSSPSTGSHVAAVVDNLFRHESGRLVASLTRLFGAEHLELAEDVVQDTLVKAMQKWPFHGIPENPAGWLRRTARNGAIDRLRRDARLAELMKEHAALLGSEWTLSATVHDLLNEAAIADDQLRMMFACCHPSIPREQQVALTLRILCGFGVSEIARAFVTNEEAITKRLYRGREAFRALGSIDIPSGPALTQRLDDVLTAIYLLFNEGYHSTHDDALIREDLIEEALRLGELLTRNPATDRPEGHALMALMIYHAARSATRIDAGGAIVLLQDQDRSKWDRELIALADGHLHRSAEGDRVSLFHIEAGIASLHAHAASFAETDWPAILRLYDRLLHLNPTAIVRINRAIAVAQVHGPEEGLRTVDAIEELQPLPLYHAARGDFLRDLSRPDDAKQAYRQALSLARSPAETALLRKKLAAVALRKKKTAG